MLAELIVANKSIIEKLRIVRYRIRKYLFNYRFQLGLCITQLHNGLNTTSKFIFDGEKSEASEEERMLIVTEADMYADNHYRSISGDIFHVQYGLNWNYDYIYGYEWVNDKLHTIEELTSADTPSDIKNVWEMSRFYHMPVLGLAYKYNKNTKYLNKIFTDIDTWILQNKNFSSVNWTISMEASIRVINLIQTISLISSTGDIDNRRMETLNSMVYNHGFYIWNNLEKGLNTNNHYLTNLIGLIWISIYFKGFESNELNRLSEKYYNFSMSQLLQELEYQISNDGFSYEDSVSYHAYNTEILLFTYAVMSRNGIDVPSGYSRKLKSMLNALNAVMSDNGIPIIGDHDSGRLFKIPFDMEISKSYYHYLMKLARKLKLTSGFGNLDSPVQLADSGIYRIFNDRFNLFVKCGPIGQNGIGGHAHNDQLSFLLDIYDKKVIIDSGTGSYTGDSFLRRKLRGTAAHNTLIVDDSEQNNIDSMFRMKESTFAEKIYLDKNTFKGRHFGYFDAYGIIFTRSMEIQNDAVVLCDNLNKRIRNECSLMMVVNDNVRLRQEDEQHISLVAGNTHLLISVDGAVLEVLNHIVSKEYGKVIKTKKIKVVMLEKEVRTKIAEIRVT